MKYIMLSIFGSIIVSMGISYIAFKYAHKNVPPSIVAMALIVVYVGIASFFDKKSE